MAAKFVQAMTYKVEDLANVQQVSLILLQYCLHLSEERGKDLGLNTEKVNGKLKHVMEQGYNPRVWCQSQHLITFCSIIRKSQLLLHVNIAAVK